MIRLLWHLKIRNLNLMLGKLEDYFINQLRFSNRLTGLTSMMSFQNTSRVSVRDLHFTTNSVQQINMLSKVYGCTEMIFLGQLADFLIIFMYASTVSFDTGNIIKQFLGVGGGLCHPPFANLPFLTSLLYGQCG